MERASAAERSADCGSLESLEGVGGLAGLADTRLWYASTRQGFLAGRLIGHRVSPSLIAEQWDEMLRLAARPNRAWSPPACWSAAFGPSSADQARRRPAGIRGGLVKTEFIVLPHPPYDRRSIHRPLDKGESISVLEDAVFCGNEGKTMRPRVATVRRCELGEVFDGGRSG